MLGGEAERKIDGEKRPEMGMKRREETEWTEEGEKRRLKKRMGNIRKNGEGK